MGQDKEGYRANSGNKKIKIGKNPLIATQLL